MNTTNMPATHVGWTYVKLTKPGILMGNALTASAGFALACQRAGQFNWGLFLAGMMGLSLIVAAGCVFNNYMDRAIDRKMSRTCSRPLAAGTVSVRNALFFATILGGLGSSILLLFTNLLALYVAIAGLVIYVFFYGFLKYLTVYGTEVGSLAGAVPPVVGYCTVSHQLDGGAALLFLIFALWQMPHFFAIALFRSQEYAAASIPVLPLVKGLYATQVRMLVYTLAFACSTTLLVFYGYAGYAYLSVAVGLSVIWLALCIQGFGAPSPEKWAHQMFRFSLIVVTLLSVMIAADGQ